MVLLAIDTCTRRASIALRDETTLRAEMTWESQRHETALVSARIADMMRISQVTPRDLSAVAVAIGPGSYTGVRCGLAIGKGLALSRALPMIGVTAFDALAHAQPDRGLPMLVVLEAGRSRAAVCRYEWQDGAPAVASDWWLERWDEIATNVDAGDGTAHGSPLYVCGELPAAVVAALHGKAVLAPPWLNLRRAGVLADLAFARQQAGEIDDAMTLTAIYPPEV